MSKLTKIRSYHKQHAYLNSFLFHKPPSVNRSYTYIFSNDLIFHLSPVSIKSLIHRTFNW